LLALLRRAAELDAHLHIDMESLDSRDAVLDLVLATLAEPALVSGPSSGVVLQAYLRDSPQQLERVLEWARRTDRAQPLVVRLVKGAYWDHEVIEARWFDALPRDMAFRDDYLEDFKKVQAGASF